MPMNSDKNAPKGHECVLDHGPFAGVRFPNISAKANGLYFFRELLHSFLITHPHLDHISGMGINTPALEYGREAKAIVALPSTIDSIKTHIFNDSIWPNLSDENHGVGFVTYRRLIEGGNPRLGQGEARGYVTVCDGLATKCWGVSHGKCRRSSQSFSQAVSHQRGDSSSSYFHGVNGNPYGDGYNFPTRRMSRMSDEFGHPSQVPSYLVRDVSYVASQYHAAPPSTPGGGSAQDSLFHPVDSSAFFIRNDITGKEIVVFGDTEPDSVSMHPRNHIVWEDAAPKFAAGDLNSIFIECSYDDSVRDADLYGHLCPRHLIAELSFFAQRVTSIRKYNEANKDEDAEETDPSPRMNLDDPPSPTMTRNKRKRAMDALGNGEHTGSMNHPASPDLPPGIGRSVSNTRRKVGHSPRVRPLSPLRQSDADGYISDEALPSRAHDRGPMSPPLMRSQHGGQHVGRHPTLASLPASRSGSLQIGPPASESVSVMKDYGGALKGLTVHIIHIKDTLADGPGQGEVVMEQLTRRAEEVELGCVFDVTSCGESIWV